MTVAGDRSAIPYALGSFRLRCLAVDPWGVGDGAISPDAASFVASSRREGALHLWFCDIRTGTWRRGTTGSGDDFEPQWSPDGNRVAFTSSRSGRKAIWVLDRRDGGVHQLTYPAHEDEYPAWSPSGEAIGYTSGPWKRRQFRLVSPAGGESRPVIRSGGHLGACSFAPTGDWLACHSYELGAGAIYLLKLDGTERVQITNGAAWDFKPAICPNRPWIAFSRAAEGPARIWLQSLSDGTGIALSETTHDDRWPSWTSDGSSLFFHRLVDEGVALMLLDRATGRMTALVGEEERPRYGSLDPTGSRVVYAASTGGRSPLRVRQLDGQAVTHLPSEGAFPEWSPDGRSIAFLSRSSSGGWRIMTLDLESGATSDWTSRYPFLRGLYGPLAWSPNGGQIAFKAETAPFEANIYTLGLRNGAVRNVTEDSWWDEAPTWSPDGRSIVFMSTRGGEWTWGFYRKNLDSGKVERVLGPDYAEKNNPRSTPGGGMVWSEAVDGAPESIYEMTPRGPRRLSDQGPHRYPSASRDDRLVLFTRMRREVQYWLAEDLWTPQCALRNRRSLPGYAPAIDPDPVSGPSMSPISLYRR